MLNKLHFFVMNVSDRKGYSMDYVIDSDKTHDKLRCFQKLSLEMILRKLFNCIYVIKNGANNIINSEY